VPDEPTASIVIPTRRRPEYLDVALRSIAPQAAELNAEVIVVSDGDDVATRDVADRHAARLIAVDPPRGANASRNAGAAAAAADLIVFSDDDVEAPAGWLRAILAGAGSAPDIDVFGGPIRARLEGGGPRACGRESAPITTLDLGPVDRDVALVWSANMAVRRRALERVGPFDESLHGRGEEEDWERRYTAMGGVIRYLAAAELEHRRSADDARVGRLARAAYALGQSARAYDVRKGVAPSLPAELRVLAGSAWHVARRRCAVGLVLVAHAAGRLRALLAERLA
jgi:glycosyltransferase involved in cell wall biosynthesis